jgi:hypothetical protein
VAAARQLRHAEKLRGGEYSAATLVDNNKKANTTWM